MQEKEKANNMPNTPHQSAGRMPLLGTYDVVVAGGGFAGFGAACAAARNGARTLLIERLEMLGGLGAAGMVGNFSYGHHFVKAQGRVFDDIVAGLHKLKSIGEEHGYARREGRARNVKVYRQDGSGAYDLRDSEPIFFNVTFNVTMLPLVLQHVALESGVQLLYATDLVGATVEDGHMLEAIIHNRSLLQRVRATVFIDGTGDGILSRHAGADELPRDDAGHPSFIQPSNMVFLHHDGSGHAASRMELLEELDEPDIERWSLWPEPGRVGIKMNLFHKPFNNADGEMHSAAVTDFRRNIPRTVRAFQERFAADAGFRRQVTARGADTLAEATELNFEFSAPMLGIREGCRIAGDYVLTVDDLLHGRRFDDGVAFAMSVLDSHHAEKKKVPPFQIPYRSFQVKGLDNVLVAGRCFSGDRLALSSTRVMPTGCLMGQACGHAAAMAVAHDHPLRDINPADIRTHLLDGAADADYMAERLAPPGHAPESNQQPARER